MSMKICIRRDIYINTDTRFTVRCLVATYQATFITTEIIAEAAIKQKILNVRILLIPVSGMVQIIANELMAIRVKFEHAVRATAVTDLIFLVIT